jgi:hypothetical protein
MWEVMQTDNTTGDVKHSGEYCEDGGKCENI